MTNAKRDNNSIPTIAGVLNTDGVTPTPVKATPSTHVVDVSDGTTGSDLGNDLADRDDNSEVGLIATDGSGNIIPLYVNSSGQLLVKST